MVENFGGSLNLIIWIILTVGAVYYSYRCLFQTKAFNDQYGFGDQAIFITRFAGSQVGAAALISIFFFSMGHLVLGLLSLSDGHKHLLQRFQGTAH